jgi:integrase
MKGQNMAQRHQEGHIRKAKRKHGAVWEFLWRESDSHGLRHQRTLVVGSVRDLPTKREALARIQILRHNINRDSLPVSALPTFSDLVGHYCQTELVDGGKTVKTQESYRVYISRWIAPKWRCEYIHSMKPVLIEEWLRSLPLADGSKAKIRNIMSAIFSYAIRYEMTDRNPLRAVRQSAKRTRIPVVLEVSELHRLFDALALRERAMVVSDALTGIRRSELMGLKWGDLDFIGRKINIVRSVVDCSIGPCKTEASRKHVPMNEHIAEVLMGWRQESLYTKPEDWVWASPHKQGRDPFWPQTIMRRFVQPAAAAVGITKRIGWHTFRHTFSTLIKSLGVDAKVVQELMRHASFRTTMDGYTQALDEPKRQAQERLANLIMRTGEVGHA